MTILKNSFFFWLLLITASTDLCADGKGLWSSIKTYFSSFQMPRSFATFKRPKLNQKWLGVGALAIAGGIILGYRYFKRPPVKKEEKDIPVKAADLWPPQDIDAFLKNQKSVQLKNPIEQEISKAQPFKTQTDIGEKSLDDHDDLDSVLNEAYNETVATQNPTNQELSLNDDDLERLLNEADEELLKTETTLTSLEIGDVVKIINDSSIDMTAKDKTLYNNLQRIQHRNEIRDFKKTFEKKFLNQIGIIRETSSTYITVEVAKEDNSTKIVCSMYLTILPKDVKKMLLLLNPPFNTIQINDWVKFPLEKNFFKKNFDENPKLKNSYNETFDNQTHYIGKILKIDPKNETVTVKHTFHFRDDYAIKETSLLCFTKNVSLIQDSKMH